VVRWQAADREVGRDEEIDDIALHVLIEIEDRH
jgi:hypothetical protein